MIASTKQIQVFGGTRGDKRERLIVRECGHSFGIGVSQLFRIQKTAENTASSPKRVKRRVEFVTAHADVSSARVFAHIKTEWGVP